MGEKLLKMFFVYEENISYVNKVQEFIHRFKLDLLSVEYQFIFVDAEENWEANTRIGSYEFSESGKTKAEAKNKVAFLVHIFLTGIEAYHSYQTHIIENIFKSE